MKALFFLFFLSLSTAFIKAQKGHISIVQDPKIEELVKVYNKINANKGFYQIQVGFGGYQKSQALKLQVDLDFPGWGSRIEFKEPTYRVRLGKFQSLLEAERRYMEVRKKYPHAMLLKPEEDSK